MFNLKVIIRKTDFYRTGTNTNGIDRVLIENERTHSSEGQKLKFLDEFALKP